MPIQVNLKTAFVLSSFFFLCASAHAQWGLTPGYRLNQADDWVLEAAATGEAPQPLLGNGPSLGVDYEIHLANTRVTFLPELSIAYFSRSGGPLVYSRAWFSSLFAHGQIYFLDLYGDCECPTFSKQGSLLQKGLFFRLSPGLTFLSNTLEAQVAGPEPAGSSPTELADMQSLTFSIGAGLGLDIGLSDRLTLTPLAEARYFQKLKWDSLSSLWSGSSTLYTLRHEESNLWQVHVGLRVGLRLDQ